MSDFDPDAYLKDTSAPFDPDAYLKQPSGAVQDQHQGFFSSVGGSVMHGLSASGAAIVGGYQGLRAIAQGEGLDAAADAVTDYQREHTYEPEGATSQKIDAAMASNKNPLTWIPKGAKKAGELSQDLGASPGVATGIETGINAIPMVLGMKGGKTAAPLDAQAALDKAASAQSMGAAAAAPNISAMSPDLQTAVRAAVQRTGGAVPIETLARHAEADSLPVKVQLTPGQATQDPTTLSLEMNNRAKTPGLPDLLNEQNKRLGQNVQAIRDQAGPDVFSTNPVEHGDTLIQAYKDKDAPIKADISAKYKALEDANGGAFPLDTAAFIKSTDAALSKKLKSNSVPSDIASNLNEFRNGRQMTFEDFESLRSDAADAARSSSDGRQKAAASIIRDQLENLPLTAEAAKLKPLADAARSAAKARFDALDADPAYDAAVHGTTSPDHFVRKFLLGPTATRDGVATMKQNLQGNDTAIQTMSVAALDHLRDSAGVGEGGSGTFSQAGFNKHLAAISPKLNSLVDPKTAEQLSTLGNVARYTQAQPKGSFVNNSNTLVGSLAEHGATAAENILNAKTGIGGTLIRKAVQNRTANKLAKETMTPYGGLTKLSDLARQ